MAEIGQDIQQAKALLEAGELVAIPTETVYGLAANGLNAKAAAKIFEAKNRPSFDPLICHTNSMEKVESFTTNIPNKAYALAEKFWPGPMTMLLDRAPIVPDLTVSGLGRVGVRIPDHELTLSLLEQLDFPLAAPSANPFGYISPTTAAHVNDQLGGKINYIIDGGHSEVGIESTIIGFENDEAIIYRLGGLSVEEIEDVIGPVKINAHSSSNPAAPGMLKSHYAPSCPVILGEELKAMAQQYAGKKVGVLGFDYGLENIPAEDQFVLSVRGDLNEAATRLFMGLRYLDGQNLDLIITTLVPDEGLGRGINDRLKRSAAKG
ncbi:L-threonylcarbamoyladenylate synthase [Persicobacter diffluens]|uniref:Threonylcarbamoyl-AMP synthase n=1 Tax=Persicobacter diffluens TaxID=981 RepID=A0AAN5AJ57_9BACT|nr:tRNA threonylcarbamoyladenosine biosynthesis protein [Persicobacter diffluens]